jgi:16S rRNA (uracil1498-N3)-methyltransferase
MTHTMTRDSGIKNGARFHVPDRLGPGAEVGLPDLAAHHATRVLRLGVGDGVILFDGSGGEYEAALTQVGRGGVRARAGRFHPGGPESALRVTLVQGVSGGDRMDFTIRKAVELGIDRIIPVFTARSVVRLGGERMDRRRSHWQAVAISACEQCGRNAVPEVDEPAAFEHWLAACPADGGPRLLLAVGGHLRLRDLPAPTAAVTLLAGPEGGFAEREAEAAASRGFVPIRLGPRVLRTETAALAALAAMQTLWGDF